VAWEDLSKIMLISATQHCFPIQSERNRRKQEIFKTPPEWWARTLRGFASARFAFFFGIEFHVKIQQSLRCSGTISKSTKPWRVIVLGLVVAWEDLSKILLISAIQHCFPTQSERNKRKQGSFKTPRSLRGFASASFVDPGHHVVWNS
jgi:hypothetical protein